jgi:TRAP-type C4-dicarboxylate transport system permease small subunit
MGGLQSLRSGVVKLLELLVITLVAVLTLVVLWGVFTRYMTKLFPFIGGQAEYTEELARLLLIWVSTFGAALAFERKAHLGVDFFVGKLHPEAGKIVAVIVELLVIALALIVFVIGGWELASGQMTQKLATMSFLTRGMVYLALPVSGLLIILFSVENMLDIIKAPAGSSNVEPEAEG